MSALKFGVSVIALAASSVAPGLAQTVETADQSQAPADEVVVTGFRLQNQLSIQAKRDNDTTADFLAADEINRQPDFNIADAFRRAPGVFTVFDEDEGRYVGIRGLNPSYTLASINGATIASSERGNRQINLEAIPASAVKRLDIFKSRTPETDGNAIGGTINLATRSAFDADGLYAAGSASIGYNDSTDVPGEGYGRSGDDGPSFRIDGTASQTFFNDTVGVVLSGSYLQRRRDQERLLPGTYNSAINGVIPLADNFLWSVYPNTIDRFGGFAKVEFKPDDKLYASFYAARYTQEDRELRHSQSYTPRGTLTDNGDGSASIPSGQAFIRFNDFFIDKPLLMLQGDFSYRFDDAFTMDGAVSYSEATFSEPSNQIQFTTANNNANLSGDYFYEDGVPSFTLDNEAYYLNPANYPFASYVFYEDDNDEYVKEARLNFGYNVDKGDMGAGVRVGGKFRNTNRNYDRTQLSYGLAPGETLTAADLLMDADYTPPLSNQPMLLIDGGAFLDYFNANRSAFTVSENSINGDYIFDEDVAAAYGQLVYGADRFKIIAGARYENTETTVNRPRDGVFVTRTYTYDDVLPSVTGYYDLTDSLKIRAAYYKAVGRPNPIELASGETTSIGGDGVPQLTRGNPELEARRADNIDVSLEYFMPGNQGIVAVAFFYKDIDNEIFRFTDDEEIDGVLTRVTQSRNVSGAKVKGFEVSFIKNSFEILPGALSGLGASANFTYVDGEIDVVGPDGEVLRTLDRMLQQPETIVNASLLYHYGPLETRLTYSRNSSTLSSVSTSAVDTTDREDAPYFQLDWQARLDLNDHFQLTAEARNLTNEYRNNYQTSEWGLALRDRSYFGRTFFVGVAAKL